MIMDSEEILQIEYKQWLFVTCKLYKKLFDACVSNGDNRKGQYECINMFQHWLLEANEDKSLHKYYYYPILPRNIHLKDEITIKLIKGIFDKFYAKQTNSTEEKKENTKKAKITSKDILLFIKESHSNYNARWITIEPFIDNKTIQCGNFKLDIFPNLEYLRKKASDEEVVSMLLRYESLGNGGYQWGDPQNLYSVLHNDYHVRYEGFASPINSRLLKYEDSRFCSLFPETDSVFGSMGNFFDFDLSKAPGGWTVNPPFVESVLEEAAKQIIEALRIGVKSWFFCTYPMWEDSIGWKLLEESKYTVKKFHRKGKTIVLQDAFGRKVDPLINLSLFCIGHKEWEFDSKILEECLE